MFDLFLQPAVLFPIVFDYLFGTVLFPDSTTPCGLV
jgi:hypothetical protein